MIENLIISLLLTILVESIIAAICGVRGKYNYITLALINIITNPVVVYCVNIARIFKLNEMLLLIILEILVVIVEGYLYKKYLNFKKINPYILALIINFTSWTIGNIIQFII